MKFLILIISIVIFGNSIAFADMRSARDALKAKDYDRAYKDFNAEAKNDNGHAMMAISRMYSNGQGVEKSPLLALEWLEKAAKLKTMTASYLVAITYLQGKDVDQDIEKAKIYLEQAAEEGVDQAPLILIQILAQQNPSDKTTLRRYFKRANELDEDNTKIANALAIMYIRGEGGEKDIEAAHDILLESSLQGNSDSQFMLGAVYSDEGTPKTYNISTALTWVYVSLINGNKNAEPVIAQLLSRVTAKDRTAAYQGVKEHYNSAVKAIEMEKSAQDDLPLSSMTVTVSRTIADLDQAKIWLAENK